MRTSLYAAPSAEPIHLTEAKLHLRQATDADGAVAYTDEDALIAAIVAAARERAEAETWRALVLQTWDLYLDRWPSAGEIRLPHPPLLAVEFVKYTDADGNLNTLDSMTYGVDTDSTPGRIVLNYGESWPSDTLATRNPIQVRFKAGYAAPFTVNKTTDIITAEGHPFADGDRVRLSVSGGELPSDLQDRKYYYVRDVSGDDLKLAASEGGAAIDITTSGSGTMLIGEVIPAGIIAGMKLLISQLYEERAEFVIGSTPAVLPLRASSLFAMDSAKEFI